MARRQKLLWKSKHVRYLVVAGSIGGNTLYITDDLDETMDPLEAARFTTRSAAREFGLEAASGGYKPVVVELHTTLEVK